MSIFQAIIYGIVQGITEFLPISSTAHLQLVPWIFGWSEPGKVFDVALHFGTAVAVIAFFYKDWIRLISSGFTKPKTQDGKLFWFLVIATIPGGLAGVTLSKYMDKLPDMMGAENHYQKYFILVGILLIVMGIVLYACDRFGKSKIDLAHMGLKRSVIVGIVQILAIIPGVSRSGITMSVGRATGVKRESIAKFTFLLSTPIILGDALYHAKDLRGVNVDMLPFVVAIVTAAVVGLLAIKFLLDYLKTKSFLIFTIYRFILGAFVIVFACVR